MLHVLTFSPSFLAILLQHEITPLPPLIWWHLISSPAPSTSSHLFFSFGVDYTHTPLPLNGMWFRVCRPRWLRFIISWITCFTRFLANVKEVRGGRRDVKNCVYLSRIIPKLNWWWWCGIPTTTAMKKKEHVLIRPPTASMWMVGKSEPLSFFCQKIK